jgi:hypothetical protein
MADEAAAHSAGGPSAESNGPRVGYADRPGLTRLLVRNFFLTLVTLGFYRFWARVRVRRYFWSNILVAGEPLEYTGTGLELFIGFLIAVAVVAPFGIVYVILQRVMLGNPVAETALSLLYFAFLVMFVQVVSFRARRYRLSRTAWRGIYAGQTGSAWRYLGMALLYGFLTVVTLGLAAPWRSIALERYKIDHSWFGESRFVLDANARDLFSRWLIVMGLLVLPVLAFIALNLSFVPEILRAQAQMQAGHSDIQMPHAIGLWLLSSSMLVLLSALGGGPALVWYWVVSFRYIASRTRLSDIRPLSHARGASVLKTVILFGLGAFALCLVMLMGFTGIGVIFYKTVVLPLGATADQAAIMRSQAAIIRSMVFIAPFAFGFYLLVIFGFQLISYWWLRVPIIRHLATTMEVKNLAAIEAIAQSAKPRQKFGIADSFDLGAI